MKRQPLIFDWSKSEASRRHKLYSVIIAGILFASAMGMIELNVPSGGMDSEAQATLIRMVDPEMVKSWALVAEEYGPFPGRLETEREYQGMMLGKEEGYGWWTDYEVSLRPMRERSPVPRVDIMPKGEREFPKVPVGAPLTQGKVPKALSLRSEPVLVPYHAAALEWLPEELPGIELPPSADRTTDWMRFLVSLREDGSVSELIPLAGSADPGQQALENWLRGIRFKKGSGERWFGLRVDFVNERKDGSEPE